MTTTKRSVCFVTTVPSPYQRDLFSALALRDDIDLSVLYLEASWPGTPWPDGPSRLRPSECVLPGFAGSLGEMRFHVNWSLPDLSNIDVVVLSSFTSTTGQWLMRRRLPGKRWLFWGERIRKQTNPLRNALQRQLTAPLAQATGIVGIGRAAQDDYAARFPRSRHFCVPYYCDVTPFLSAARNGVSAGPITFLFCGQMIYRKGVDLLLVAFERLVSKGLDVVLLLVGREADLPRFLTLIGPKARARVRYEGLKPPDQLPEYFARADILVLPSRHDGWGVVVNQALAAGLPVITSDVVGAGMDLVTDGLNGLKFVAGEVSSLQRTMETAVTDRDRLRLWGQASRERAQELTPEAGAAKWVEVLDSVVTTRCEDPP